MIKVAIVEDIDSIREGISYLISSSDKMEVVESHSMAEYLLDSLSVSGTSLPNIVLMDIHLPGIDGIEATRRIKDLYPNIEVMMLTVFEDEKKIFESIKAGATGYILKDTPRRNLIAEIIEIMGGGSPMTPRIARKILDEFSSKKVIDKEEKLKLKDDILKDTYNLSKREKEILKFMVNGFTYTQIAEELNISPNTVRKHIQNTYQKLQVNSKAILVKKAIYEKLV